MFLAAANANRNNVSVKKRSEIICKCWYRALEQSNSPLAIKLLSWHIQHLGKPSGAYSNSLVEYAVSINDLAVVQIMQTSGYLDEKKSPHTQDIIKGLLENQHPQAMLQYFEANHLISLSSYYRRKTHDEARSLIDLAVHHSCVPLVEAAFAVATYSLDTKQGLREAISQNNLPMVELFLKNGADPEGVDSWSRGPEFHRSTCELARPDSQVYKIIREALATKVRRRKGIYKSPILWVWDIKKQMDVPVAYTFHAPDL